MAASFLVAVDFFAVKCYNNGVFQKLNEVRLWKNLNICTGI